MKILHLEKNTGGDTCVLRRIGVDALKDRKRLIEGWAEAKVSGDVKVTQNYLMLGTKSL